MYAVLKSSLGGRQADLDSFIRASEPTCEVVKDSRGREVTIYTRLRNAKGHPTGMAPDEASKRIVEKLRRRYGWQVAAVEGRPGYGLAAWPFRFRRTRG
jgi:hypothetical protein